MLTLIRCPFLPCVTAMPRKRPQSFCKSAGGRLHLNRHTPLTQRSRSGLTMLSEHGVETYPGNELTGSLPGNSLPQSSQLSEPLWTDLSLKSGTGKRELISTLIKAQVGIDSSKIFPQNPGMRGRSQHHHRYFSL